MGSPGILISVSTQVLDPMKFCPDRKIVSKFALAALVLGLSTRSVRTAETAGRELPDELPPITVASGLDILLRYAALNNAGVAIPN